MDRKRSFIFSAVLLAAALMGCGHQHQWAEANCKSPATCMICGETEGETGDHVWKDATCTEPRLCTICGKTEGAALGHKWAAATTEKPKTCSVCGETEGEALKKAIVSDWAYPGIWYISDRYLIVKSPDKKVFLIDYDGNRIPKGAFSEDIEIIWDIAYLNMQDGCFICRVDKEDGTYRSYLIDKDLNVLINFNDPKGYIEEYRDNCWKAHYPAENRIVYYPMMPENKELKGVSFSLDEYNWISPVSYGCFLYNRNYLLSDDDNPLGSFRIMPSDYNFLLTGRRYRVKKEDVFVFNNAVSEEGWTSAKIGSWEKNPEKEGNYVFKETSYGFYNIKTNEYIPAPPGVIAFGFHAGTNGCISFSVVNGLATLSETTDPFLYRVFNLYTGEYETKEQYLHLELSPHRNLLVQNTDGKWGYLNSSDFLHEGEWYDDASSFCNGYALINKNGREFLINEELEIVSEGFDGKSAYTAFTDYQVFRKEEMGAVFNVYDGENYHLVRFE
ncbi:MAG: hypothetical protein IJT43_10600 [Stomatobaculum sp.]|nr:hypothetical protein [Stomatobaculum sp.]